MIQIPERWQRPSHAEERAMVVESFRTRGVSAAPIGILECTQSVCGLESAYGSPDKPLVWGGSCQHGAILHHAPSCPNARTLDQPWPGHHCFAASDSTPNPDGTSKVYGCCFRAYDSHLEGVGDVVAWMLRHPKVLAAAKTGDPTTFSTAMFEARYFLGFGKTDDERIGHHRDRVEMWIAMQRRALRDGASNEYPTTTAYRYHGRDLTHLVDDAMAAAHAERDREIAGDVSL